MKFTRSEYYDDQDGKFVAEKFYINGDEVCEDEFFEMLEDLEEFNGENDEIAYYENDEIEYDDCCPCDCPCETNSFLVAVTDLVNDTLEMFEDPNTCDDCKFRALMDLVTMGVDGALQGYIVRNGD